MDDLEETLTGDLASPGLPKGIDSDEIVLVSRRVVGGLPILFAWRDQPDEDDSGWTMLSGTEPDSALQNRHKFVQWSVGEVVDLDPSIAPLLSSPPDTTFERESVDAPWIELVEDADADEG